MGESADEVTVMEARTVCRNLTLSTLFPHRADESSEEKEIQVSHRENSSDDADADCCGGQGRNKGKIRGKVKPQRTPAKMASANGKGCLNGMMDNRDSPVRRRMKSPRKPLEKQQTNTTPNKKAKVKGNNSAEPGFGLKSTSPFTTEDKAQNIPDLRLEAKLSAEENSRIFAGKQIHPFFSSRKLCKEIRETAKEEAGSFALDKNNSSEFLGPIHVFESAQDSTPVLDWSHWIFSERSLFNCNQAHELMDHSSPESFIHSGNYLKVTSPSSTSSLANGIAVDHPAENGFYNPALIDEKVEHEMGRVGVCSNHAVNGEYSLEENRNISLQNRNQASNCWNKDMLWTKKYQPERATEVCGNSESVKYLSEWLRIWYAKALQCRESATLGPKNTSKNSDHDYYESDCDSEKISQGAKLKNVLLVTGPIGSGKSAAIYACAKEQGFNVIEVNTSDWRNGALVKQKFGEAVESHSVKRLNENEASPSEEHKFDSLNHHKRSQEADNEVAELMPVANEDGACNSVGISPKMTCVKSKLPCDRDHLKTLVVFDDVDIAFTEDRGFIGSIQNLARTAKLPIILTANGNQPILPDSLDRVEIFFCRPSLKDLLDHVIDICTAEKASIEPSLIPSFIEFFHGDIRKTIMHLQFWCQSKACAKDKKMQENYATKVFDLDVAHQLLMNLIPGDFASELSELSELIEFELNKSLHLPEEYSTVIERNEEKYPNEIRQHGFQIYLNEDWMVANKDTMLKSNTHRPGYDPSETEVETQDFFDSSGSLVAFSRQNNRRKGDYVLSLSRGDEMYDYNSSAVSTQEATHGGHSLVDRGFMMPCSPKPANYISPSTAHNKNSPNPLQTIIPFAYEENLGSHVQFSETIFQNSCGGLDECSQMDFNRHEPICQNDVCKKTGLVQEAWERLRGSRQDLGKYVTSEQKHASQILNVTFAASNLISEADLLLPDFHLTENDHGELSTISSEVPDTFQRYAEQLHMTSTFSDHGLRLYAKDVMEAVSSVGETCKADLAQEMLTYSTDMMALEKLVAQGVRTSKLWPPETSDSGLGVCGPSHREENSSRVDIVRSIVPTRSYLAVRGETLHEYLSSLNNISRSETSRLSASVDKPKRRRGRPGLHYLSSGGLSLSLEDISLLDRHPVRSDRGDA